MDFDQFRCDFNKRMDDLVLKYREEKQNVEDQLTKQMLAENIIPTLSNFKQKKDFFEKIAFTPQKVKQTTNPLKTQVKTRENLQFTSPTNTPLNDTNKENIDESIKLQKNDEGNENNSRQTVQIIKAKFDNYEASSVKKLKVESNGDSQPLSDTDFGLDNKINVKDIIAKYQAINRNHDIKPPKLTSTKKISSKIADFQRIYEGKQIMQPLGTESLHTTAVIKYNASESHQPPSIPEAKDSHVENEQQSIDTCESKQQIESQAVQSNSPIFYKNNFEEKCANILNLFETRIQKFGNNIPLPPSGKFENYIKPANETKTTTAANSTHVVENIQKELPCVVEEPSSEIAVSSSDNLKSEESCEEPQESNEDANQNTNSITFLSTSDSPVKTLEHKTQMIDSHLHERNEPNEGSEDDKEIQQSTSTENLIEMSSTQGPVSSNTQFCSTFTDDLKKLDAFPDLDPILQEGYLKYDQYIEAINEEANNLNSYINNFKISNSREIYLTNLRKRLDIQQLIEKQLIQFENAIVNSKKTLMVEQSSMFAFLRFKTRVNIEAIESHLNYCQKEENPIFGLIKGNGTLSVSDVSLSLNRNSGSKFEAGEIHVLTAFFQYDGSVSFLSPVLINRRQDVCDFVQKLTFSDLPPEFKLRFVIAELIYKNCKASHERKSNIIDKVKGILKKTKHKMNPKKSKLVSKSKTCVKKALHHTPNAAKSSKSKNQDLNVGRFVTIGEILINKHSVSECDFKFTPTAPSSSTYLATSQSVSNTILSGKLSMNLDISYNVDLEFSGNLDVMSIDRLGDRYWVLNHVSLTNGKLFLWSLNYARGDDCPVDCEDQCEKRNSGKIRGSSNGGYVGGSGEEMKLNEVILLSRVTRFDPDASQVCGSAKSHRPYVILLEITRNWTASDQGNSLQKIVGNMLVRQIYLSASNRVEYEDWIRSLKIVIESHKEWKH